MSLLKKLFGAKAKVETEAERPACPHPAVVPRWDSVEDMGKLDKATSFVCTACDQAFTPEEAAPYQKGA
jgi:hypothetical protein